MHFPAYMNSIIGYTNAISISIEPEGLPFSIAITYHLDTFADSHLLRDTIFLTLCALPIRSAGSEEFRESLFRFWQGCVTAG